MSWPEGGDHSWHGSQERKEDTQELQRLGIPSVSCLPKSIENYSIRWHILGTMGLRVPQKKQLIETNMIVMEVIEKHASNKWITSYFICYCGSVCLLWWSLHYDWLHPSLICCCWGGGGGFYSIYFDLFSWQFLAQKNIRIKENFTHTFLLTRFLKKHNGKFLRQNSWKVSLKKVTLFSVHCLYYSLDQRAEVSRGFLAWITET